ncbi:MFS transporter [Sandarakinorhabdus oryzae]|uniref:MFS transporter n=1 Tax=Sandarakinorhabdus oryzae TaxID=2675220 RepID=UPI0012E118A4|nr:MFS transporter [Sandarakinorhabdus oryzae]
MAQAARDPYVILITIYIFAPWFVRAVVGDPIIGQALVAQGGKWGGWAVMVSMPLLGAMIDRLGPRKPLLCPVILAMAACSFSLWWVVPAGHDGLGIAWVIGVGAVMTWLFAAHEMLHNSLLVPAAGMAGAARASGLGLAGGNAMSVGLLILLMVAFVLPGTVNWSWLPAAPLFGLDPALGEPARITGPIVAGLMLVGSLPLFALVPDRPRSSARLGAAFAGGASDLWRLLSDVRGYRNPMLYLVARMLFTDGLTCILLFGGIFAAGVMGWGTLQMLGYGITLSIAAVAGGLLASRLDGWFGPRRALMGELLLLILIEAVQLGSAKDHIFYRPAAATPLWDGPMFTTLPELVFLGLGCGVAVTVTSAYASSRTLLTRLAPPDRLGAFFGLYALSGTATMWLGPLLLERATLIGGTQAAGFVPVVGLLATGLLLLLFVRGGGRLEGDG